jgi:hypothetical protein
MRFTDMFVSRETNRLIELLSPFSSGDIIAALAR